MKKWRHYAKFRRPRDVETEIADAIASLPFRPWKDKNNAWQTGGGAMWVTGSYDPDTNRVLWGTGNPMPWSDPTTARATTPTPTA